MSKKILIDARYEIVRTAIVEDGRLVDFHEENVSFGQLKGNLYRGVVRRVEASLQASFIDIGTEKHGFLQLREIHKKYYSERHRNGHPRLQEILRPGDGVLVQVARDAVGTKGPVLTTYISLPGRYLVLMPESDGGGISQKIKDEQERAEMRKILERLNSPAGSGVILRTAALNQTKRELDKDLTRLVRLWNQIRSDYNRMKGPGLLYKDQDIVVRYIRDYFTTDVSEVLINDADAFEVAQEYFRRVMPRYGEKLKHYKETAPLFDRHNVEEEIARSHEPIVPLPSGGSLVIEQTEALVSIDVNTGRATSGRGLEETVTHTNMEAADEAARQLRLRDLGGLVVIDFIDMANPANRRRLERRMRDALKSDKARIKVGMVSSFGLLQLSRQRIRRSLGASTHEPCPECAGRGWVISNEVICLDVLRRIQLAASRTADAAEIRVKVNRNVALHLLNVRRTEIKSIEEDSGVRIVIEIGTDTRAEVVDIEVVRGDKGGITIARQGEQARRRAGGQRRESPDPAGKSAGPSSDPPSRRRRRRRKPAGEDGGRQAEREPATAAGAGREASRRETPGRSPRAPQRDPQREAPPREDVRMEATPRAESAQPAPRQAAPRMDERVEPARKRSLLDRLTTIFTGVSPAPPEPPAPMQTLSAPDPAPPEPPAPMQTLSAPESAPPMEKTPEPTPASQPVSEPAPPAPKDLEAAPPGPKAARPASRRSRAARPASRRSRAARPASPKPAPSEPAPSGQEPPEASPPKPRAAGPASPEPAASEPAPPGQEPSEPKAAKPKAPRRRSTGRRSTGRRGSGRRPAARKPSDADAPDVKASDTGASPPAGKASPKPDAASPSGDAPEASPKARSPRRPRRRTTRSSGSRSKSKASTKAKSSGEEKGPKEKGKEEPKDKPPRPTKAVEFG